MRPCDGCKTPKDDRRWMTVDGASLCFECVRKCDDGVEHKDVALLRGLLGEALPYVERRRPDLARRIREALEGE